MKKLMSFFLCLGICLVNPSVLPGQTQEENKDLSAEIRAEMLKKNVLIYNPAGRRDPFRNLLEGKDTKEKNWLEGIPQISIDDIVLTGIVKGKGKFTAIISGPEGFPYFIQAGDKFADGFVLSIKKGQVVFRKTKEKGLPLFRPKDITKEIYPEER